jgi:hypothetical protein
MRHPDFLRKIDPAGNGKKKKDVGYGELSLFRHIE